MALIKCKNCGKEISSKANSCPNCGKVYNYKNSNNSVLYLIICSIIGFIIGFLFFYL